MLGLTARIHFWEQMAVSLKAGFSVEDSLRQAASTKGPGARLARDLSKPEKLGLSRAVARFPGTFSDLEISLVEASEMAGSLPETLPELVEHLKWKRRSALRLGARLAYPFLVVHLAAIAGVLAPALRDSQMQGLFWRCVLVLLPFYGITFLILGGPPLVRCLGESAALFVDRSLLRLPFVGKYTKEEVEKEFFWLLGTLLKAGVDVRESVSFLSERAGNRELRRQLRPVLEDVKNGQPFGEALYKVPALSRGRVSRIETAEQAGELSGQAMRLYAEAKEGAELSTQGFSGALFGFYLVVMAVYAGWAVVGFYRGLYDFHMQF